MSTVFDSIIIDLLTQVLAGLIIALSVEATLELARFKKNSIPLMKF